MGLRPLTGTRDDGDMWWIRSPRHVKQRVLDHSYVYIYNMQYISSVQPGLKPIETGFRTVMDCRGPVLLVLPVHSSRIFVINTTSSVPSSSQKRLRTGLQSTINNGVLQSVPYVAEDFALPYRIMLWLFLINYFHQVHAPTCSGMLRHSLSNYLYPFI